jgi:hypothetical protein
MENSLIISNDGMRGITFEINGQKKTISDIDKLNAIATQINEIKNYIETYAYYLKYYENFEECVNNDISSFFIDDLSGNDDNHYQMNEDYRLFMDGIESNDEAVFIIKAAYEKEYGTDHTIIFDPEYSYAYISTKKEAEAKQFLLFTYRNYIKPFLDKI